MDIINQFAGHGQPRPTNHQNHPSCDALLKNAAETLETFKKVSKTEYMVASSLFDAATNILEQEKVHWHNNKRRLLEGDWTQEDVDSDMNGLRQRLSIVWEKIMDDAKKSQERIDEQYRKVLAVEQAVSHACGGGWSGSYIWWMGGHAPDQIRVLAEYNHKLRFEFEASHQRYQQLCGDPDGLFNKFKICHRRFLQSDPYDPRDK